MRYRTILFDLDGTVIDTVPLIVASHQHALRQVLGVELPVARLRAGIGRPLLAQMRAFDEARAHELFDAYRAFNHAQHDALAQPFAGLLELLGELRGAGAKLGIVTSKSALAVGLATRLVPFARHVGAIVTADDSTAHKPGPEPLWRGLRALGRGAAAACYVGDATADLQAARAAGLASVAVTWGAGEQHELRAEAPDHLARTPAELRGILLGDDD